ncbi:MAG: class I SAM-dependent methyltransferase [Planctomycetes bacterium]|nr:class I SAM-dependent methyltransferase [Planctomycetota bacterium]
MSDPDFLDCIAEQATGLKKSPDGVWVSATRSEVSYPDDGSDHCFEVEDSSFWFAHRNRIIRNAVAQFPPAGPVFDIGGGNGIVTREIMEAGFPGVLVEPSPAAIRNARKRGINGCVCSTLRDAEFAEGSIPAIGMFDVLEHIENDVEFAAQTNHVLIPGGRLYLTVPAFNCLWSEDDRTAGHFRRYRRREIQTCLERAGFRVLYCTYFFAPLFLPIMVRRSFMSWIGVRKRKSEIGRSEHVISSAWSRMLFGWFSSWEARKTASTGHVPFGSSILVVAETSSTTQGFSQSE